MRGRKPPGPEFVYRLEGSAQSKQRACAILQTLAGQLSLEAASDELAISTQRLHELRQRSVQALVDSLEAQPAGRPPHELTESAELTALRAEVARLRQELQAAQLRSEIAALLPGRAGRAGAEKKTRQRRL
jgi:HAMP domain-containing protein